MIHALQFARRRGTALLFSVSTRRLQYSPATAESRERREQLTSAVSSTCEIPLPRKKGKPKKTAVERRENIAAHRVKESKEVRSGIRSGKIDTILTNLSET